MALQFRRYQRSQVFAFDFGGSIRAAALAMGGDWHDLGGELTDGAAASVSLQPLARIHETPERAWAADWMVAILVRESRSEEHTSELQSLMRISYAVFCLKKKNTQQSTIIYKQSSCRQTV